MRWSSKCLCAGQQEQASRRRGLDGECAGRKADVKVYQLWRLDVVGGRVEGLRRRLRDGRRTGNVQGNMTPRRLRLRCGRWRLGLVSDDFAPSLIRHSTQRKSTVYVSPLQVKMRIVYLFCEDVYFLCIFLRHFAVCSTPPGTKNSPPLHAPARRYRRRSKAAIASHLIKLVCIIYSCLRTHCYAFASARSVKLSTVTGISRPTSNNYILNEKI